MTASGRDSARPRGVAVGLLTAALTAAAHGLAGGGMPSGSMTVVLSILAATVGVLAGTIESAARVPALIGLLGAGQLGGPLLSSATGHQHVNGSAVGMLAAHVAATVVGAVLISAGDRLCRVFARTARRVIVRLRVEPTFAPEPPITAADQPLYALLVLRTSLSHRGPPVAVAI